MASACRGVVLFVLVLWSLVVGPASANAQATGLLDVKANVADALVLLDGEPLGTVPLLEVVAAGRHTVLVTRPGFADSSHTIDVPPDSQVEVLATLRRIDPALEVTADVDTARVSVDGKLIGTGALVRLDPARPGSHQVAVEAPGYGQWVGVVTLRPGEVTPVKVALRGTQGAIAVKTEPAGALVLVDGREAGRAPTRVDPVPPGSHGIRLRLDGRADVLQTVVVDPGRVVQVEATLAEAGGALEVRPNSDRARVFVNGVDIGAGKQQIESLQPGMYSLRVTAPGYTDFLKTVQVEVGKKTAVAARLVPFSGGTSAVAEVPVGRRPAFWAALGGGIGAGVAAAVIAGVAATQVQDVPDPTGVTPPTADARFALP